MVLFTCIGSQQYLLSTGCDLVPCQCTLVENDNFYYVRAVSQRLSNCPSSRFCVPTSCPDFAQPYYNVNMCPFAESSFWYQALQLFLSHIIRRQMFANLTVNKLSYSAIAKQKITCVIGNNVLKVLRLDISLRLALVSPYALYSLLIWINKTLYSERGLLAQKGYGWKFQDNYNTSKLNYDTMLPYQLFNGIAKTKLEVACLL